MLANASSSLPALPVPDLETTCHKYLASVKPLVSADDYAKTEQAVQAFLAADGPGCRLQARLHDRAARVNAQGTGSSWLEAWWNEYAYFANRVSNCFYVNFYFGLRDDPRHPKQLERAATLTKAALDFYALLANNQLSPDMARTTPLCMFQYRYLYNTCRYPDTPLDYTVHHDAPTNSHIAVVSRGQFYVFDTVTTTGHGTTRPLSREELLAQFEHVQQLARRSTAPGIGILTSESRDQWAATRGHLVAVDPRNRAHLQRLESARFLVCLEDHAPVT
ncbi:Carnitine O-acetyltransferase mitochondrial, partial [Dimargaris verticillata]